MLEIQVVRGVPGQQFQQVKGRTVVVQCVLRRPDNASDAAESKVGIGELLAELRVVASLLQESLVIGQGRFQKFLPQVANIERILLFEQGILADIGQVIVDGLLRHLEVGFRFTGRFLAMMELVSASLRALSSPRRAPSTRIKASVAAVVIQTKATAAA